MPDLQHELALLGEVGQRARVLHAVGDRLLDQDMHARIDQRARDLVMERGRHRHAHRVDAANDLTVVEQGLGAELGSDGAGALLAGVDHGDQLGARIARIMVGVKAPEIASPHNGDADLVCHGSTLTATRRRPLP